MYIKHIRTRKKVDTTMARGIHAGKRIQQLNYETGEIIKEYDTLTQAAQDAKVTQCAIRRAIQHANGCMHLKKLRFRYLDTQLNAAPIIELDYHTGEIVQRFDSIEDVLNFFGLSRAGLYRALYAQNGCMPYKQLRFAMANL